MKTTYPEQRGFSRRSIQYNTIQYNNLMNTPQGDFSIKRSIKRFLKDKEIKTKGIVSNEQLDHEVHVIILGHPVVKTSIT